VPYALCPLSRDVKSRFGRTTPASDKKGDLKKVELFLEVRILFQGKARGGERAQRTYRT
jgi:hypothetical protein